jgi:hypothetical protein
LIFRFPVIFSVIFVLVNEASGRIKVRNYFFRDSGGSRES